MDVGHPFIYMYTYYYVLYTFIIQYAFIIVRCMQCMLTGIIWKDHREFISGGKDSKLVMHAFKDAARLCDKANPISLSFNIEDQFALAINERLQISSGNWSGRL